ncbi:MAG: AAA family ATPase [Deltaproteobacteria bacterium]|nr:AAA family ATPase [Deltaproteobacteria bacterium]
MIISHIKMKNWRNFRNVDIPLGRRVFLVGANASGKSNFLDAFRFLCDIAKSEGGGLQKAVSERGGLSKIRCLAARKELQVEIEVNLAESHDKKTLWKYAIGIKQKSRGHRQTYVFYERVWKGTELILDRPDKQDKKDEMRLNQTHLEQINANLLFRDIVKFFNSIYYLHLVPQVLRHPEIFTGPVSKEDPFGRSFLERIVQTPVKTRRSRLKKIEKALKIAVPQLKQLTDTRDERGVPHLEAIYEHWRPKAGKQSEEQFSDGTLRLIGFLWSILEGDALLLMEEPELSLHSAIVRKLPGLIWRIQNKKKRQIIISTHSSDLLSDKGIGGEEVLLLTPDVEGTKVKQASSVRDVKILLDSGFSISEAALPKTEPKNSNQLSLFNG